MTTLKQFQTQSARPLPVIVLADTSGSMSCDGKIEALNLALKDMISAFATESRLRAELQVAVITFGGSADVHLPLTAAHKINQIQNLPASGDTPMGAALTLAVNLIEDKERIPSRAYKPVIILVSDGHPTDNFGLGMEQLISNERSAKATRYAMGIGSDADLSLLNDFISDPEAPVFKAENARDIQRFFKAVTMSVKARSQSTNPNQAAPLLLAPSNETDDEFEELDF